MKLYLNLKVSEFYYIQKGYIRSESKRFTMLQ